MATLILALIFFQTSVPTPKFDWVFKSEKDVAVVDLQRPRAIRFSEKASTKVKLLVAAEFPVNFAIRSREEAPSSVSCINRQMYKTQAVCVLPSDTAWFVVNNALPDKTHPKINKVNVTLYVWKCVQNCPVEKAAAP
jgi:hypothetical protein